MLIALSSFKAGKGEEEATCCLCCMDFSGQALQVSVALTSHAICSVLLKPLLFYSKMEAAVCSIIGGVSESSVGNIFKKLNTLNSALNTVILTTTDGVLVTLRFVVRNKGAAG